MTMTAPDWPDFYFARHGETDWNREQRYQGSRDIPLNRRGQLQADANGVLLRQMLERDGVDPKTLKWFASPLSRAAEYLIRRDGDVLIIEPKRSKLREFLDTIEPVDVDWPDVDEGLLPADDIKL